MVVGVAAVLAFAPAATAQVRPYIGFVYPAGGQQGTTFRIKLGGQGLDDVNQVFVTGSGVAAKVLEYNRPLGAQELTLLNEQLKELKRATNEVAPTMLSAGLPMTTSENPSVSSPTAPGTNSPAGKDEAALKLIARLERRIAETVNRPASVSLANIVYVEVAIAADAPPGPRELRLGTPRGISNPLVFEVGQLPEVCRKPMLTAPLQILGKEELAVRKRPPNEIEDRVTVPCILNGQIASGELNRYRFAARHGQRLVITTEARQLIPFIADAVPGWFQPVLVLYDAQGKEVAYDDDYRFKPDPAILYEVPQDGEYVLAIYDAIYRGREDFVYRITLGEVPFLTSIFPLGGPLGAPVTPQTKGWNLESSVLCPPAKDTGPGVSSVAVTRAGLVSNRLPFALDTLPECSEIEPNDTPALAQKVSLPVIINGRIDRPGDWDVFQFTGQSNDTLVAEVYARRLDSPLDSLLKLTDAAGRLLAFNDDHEDPGAGLNTHDADSYLMARLPADGTYYVHLGDTAHNGGEEYGYRLRLSAPQPDFELRVVPSSISLRSKNSATFSVHAIRKDGFTGPIKLTLQEPPAGFSAAPVSLSGTQAVARLALKTSLVATKEPVNLCVVGTAKLQDRDVTHPAVPAEDRMQAFLWRHLVPASELKVLVFDPAYQPPPKRVPRVRPAAEAETKPVKTKPAETKPAETKPAEAKPAEAKPAETKPAEIKPAETKAVEAKPAVAAADSAANKPKFTKQQVAGRLRQLKLLFEEGLLTDDFYDQKVAECEAAR